MDAAGDTYEFHSRLESFSAFLAREWKAVAFFGGGFVALMLAAVLVIDPAFFYPRLQTDPLNYWLKVQSLVTNGSTAAHWAINTGPFPYAAMPGVLRAPALFLFDDFDAQLRAMQVMGIVIALFVGLLSSFIFSWSQPASRHWLVIAFAFAFLVLSPVWVANVFLPLADAPYAAFSLGSIVVAVRILCSDVPLKRQWRSIVLFIVLFGIAFSLRYTAPAVLVMGALLAREHWREHSLSKRATILITSGVVAVLVALVAFNHQAIFGRYLAEPLFYYQRARVSDMLLNFFGASLPSQVVPNFETGFAHPTITSKFATTFTSSRADMAWMMVGLSISAIAVTGAVASRGRFLSEILYVLTPIPVLGAIVPSTTRYMMSYQPFIWIFFASGAAIVARKLDLRRRLSGHRVALIAASIVLVAGVIGLRLYRMAGTASERNLTITASQAPAYISDVAHTFRNLRGFLATLPRDSSLLIGDHGFEGRWKAISGLDYYTPDSALSIAAGRKHVYMLVECGTLETCTGWNWYVDKMKERVTKFGQFEFDSVYSAKGTRARAQVYRVRSTH